MLAGAALERQDLRVLATTPSRISIARWIVGSASHAGGPSITVRRYGISASLMPQVALFHR